MPKPIELSIDSNNNLVLSDGGTTKAGNVINRKVSWKIKDQKIESFKVVGKDPGDPFTESPNSSFDTKLHLEVRLLGPTGDWYYSIIWKDKATYTEHTYDPKIAVKPVALNLKTLVILLVSTVICLLTVRFFRMRKIDSHAGMPGRTRI